MALPSAKVPEKDAFLIEVTYSDGVLNIDSPKTKVKIMNSA